MERSMKGKVVRESNTKICPECEGMEMVKYYTDANDIVLLCRKCQYTELGDPKEREESIKKGIEEHIKKMKHEYQ